MVRSDKVVAMSLKRLAIERTCRESGGASGELLGRSEAVVGKVQHIVGTLLVSDNANGAAAVLPRNLRPNRRLHSFKVLEVFVWSCAPRR